MNNSFKKISQLFFYLFFAFFPFQIDALVVSGEIYFSGFFNPYLSHFIYVGDLFLFLSFLFLIFSFLFGSGGKVDLKKSFSKNFLGKNKWIYFGVGALFLFYVLSILFAHDSLNSFFYSLRVLEFVFVFYLLSTNFVSLKKLVYVFVGVVSFVALVGVLQYVLQESLGLWFLGEPVVSSGELGVAKVSLFDSDVLRVYGTFPHPNIFAGYLVFAILLMIYRFEDSKILFSSLISVCLLALVFTFSRSAFLALFVGLLFYYFVSKTKISLKNLVFVFLGGLFVLLSFDLLPVLFERMHLFSDSGFSERVLFFSTSKNMFLDNLLGVGAGNFTAVMQDYSSLKLLPWMFQPVHNMYLLVFNELGVFGGFSFVFFFVYVFVFLVKKNKKQDEKLRHVLMVLWLAILVIGFFDHYFVSLYQGQALFYLFLGMVGGLK